MAFQTDVKSTKPLTATGVFKTQSDANMAFRTRIKAVYITCGVSDGSVTLSDGAGGPTVLTLNAPTAANAGYIYVLVPDRGILLENGLHGTVVNAASVTVFYG